MPQDSGRWNQIAWSELFPWLRLGRAPGEAFGFVGLTLSAAGLIAMWAGWRLLGALFGLSDDPALCTHIDALASPPWEWPYDSLSQPGALESILVTVNRGFWATQERLSATGVATFDQHHGFFGFLYYFLCTVWSILVWSIFGGALTRRAALSLTRGDRLGLRGSLRFAMKRWLSFSSGPLLVLAAVLLLALPLALSGWIMRSDFGAAVVGALWPLVVLIGGAIAVLAAGLLLSWPLMWPTIGVEATDAFDGAQSRVFVLAASPVALPVVRAGRRILRRHDVAGVGFRRQSNHLLFVVGHRHRRGRRTHDGIDRTRA
ncbi:MAG: hypothetical protein QM811_14845 [Pirellulales bacterium]